MAVSEWLSSLDDRVWIKLMVPPQGIFQSVSIKALASLSFKELPTLSSREQAAVQKCMLDPAP